MIILLQLIKAIYKNTKYLREGAVTIFIDNKKIINAIEDRYQKAT